MLMALKYIHLLTIVIWIGSIIFFSFIGAPTVFKTFDRTMAGDVVGAIFPKYYTLGLACSLMALSTLVLISLKTNFTFHAKAGIAAILIMGAATIYSTYVVWPKAHELKYQIRAESDEGKIVELKKKFVKYHGISMILNIATLAFGLMLLYFTLKYLYL
jgi:uncharacterized membrane protein